MFKNLTIASACVLAFAATSANAAEVEPTGRNGVYVQANVVNAWSNASGVLDETDLGESIGANARAGYRFHPNWSVELQGEWIDEFDEQTPLGDSAARTGGAEVWSVGGNARLHMGTGFFQGYLITGLHYVDLSAEFPVPFEGDRGVQEVVDGDESGLGIRVGGGLDLYVTDNIYLNVGGEYMIGTGDLENFNYATFGLGAGFRI